MLTASRKVPSNTTEDLRTFKGAKTLRPLEDLHHFIGQCRYPPVIGVYSQLPKTKRIWDLDRRSNIQDLILRRRRFSVAGSPTFRLVDCSRSHGEFAADHDGG